MPKKKASKSKTSSKKTKRKVSHAGAGKKGKQFERECADMLGEVFPEAKRHLESQQAECGGFDLDNTGIFRFQCKRYAAYCNPSKIEEIRTPNSEIPVLLTRGDKKKAVAVLYFEDFIDILGDHLNYIDLGQEVTRLKLQLEKSPPLLIENERAQLQERIVEIHRIEPEDLVGGEPKSGISEMLKVSDLI